MSTAYYRPYWDNTDELEHFGIKGMKWGIRRYQNPDGTLTEAGKKRLEKYKTKEYSATMKAKTGFEDIQKKISANKKKKGIEEDPRDTEYVKNRLKMYDKELKGILAMSYSDMKAEKREKAMGFIRSFLYQPIAISQIYTEDVITKMRINR